MSESLGDYSGRKVGGQSSLFAGAAMRTTSSVQAQTAVKSARDFSRRRVVPLCPFVIVHALRRRPGCLYRARRVGGVRSQRQGSVVNRAGRRVIRGVAEAAALLLLFAGPANGQADGQLWATVTFNWLRSDQLTYELELEPKVLVVAPEGVPGWASLDVTPNVEFAVRNWLDLVGELATGYTSQTDDVNSFELSPRIGLRFHLTTRDLPTGPFVRERLPRRRLVIRDLVRFERRNLFYSDGRDTETVGRFRNRLELQIPLNRERVTDNGVQYVLVDWEWFVPLDDPDERFASRQRVRAGIGYRLNLNWRFEALYIWNRSRDPGEESFRRSDNVVNLRMKRVF